MFENRFGLLIYIKQLQLKKPKGKTMKFEINTKFLAAAAMSVFLAACAGQPEQIEEDLVEEQVERVETYVQEEVDSSALQDAKAQLQAYTLYYFAFDSYNLNTQARADLDVVAKLLKASGEKVRLEGHADERGSRDYNLALGEKRANAVANYLTVQGVKASQLEIISYGKEKPAVLGSNEDAWSKNRRVELAK